MGNIVGKSESTGFFSRLFGSTEVELDVKNVEVVSEIIDNSQSESKSTPSLLGRVTKGAVKVAKSLTSTQLLVMVTLLSITALIILLTFPVIKPFLIGVPVFVAFAGFATTKGIAIFLITKTLALLGLSLSGVGLGLKGLMGLFSHFSSKGKAANYPQTEQKMQSMSEKTKETQEFKKPSPEPIKSWAEEFAAEEKASKIVLDSNSPELEKVWKDETSKTKPGTQERAHGGVIPTPSSATEDLSVADWSPEYLSSKEEILEVDSELESRFEAAYSEQLAQSPAQDRLVGGFRQPYARL